MAARGDGYYWRFELKMETMHGHIVYKTETAAPITVHDDLGASHIVLSHEIYLLMGEPWTEPMSGNGFGGKIQMKRLTLESKATYHFFYKIAGIEMDWQCFIPHFFPENADFQARDLSLLNTYGWMEQADLAEQNIGFVQCSQFRITGYKTLYSYSYHSS